MTERPSGLHFEDFAVGQVYELGSREVTREEIVGFAEQFDPQPFHVDEDAARNSAFGGLIASGWHTGALFMRLYVDGMMRDAAGMGSPGVDELRWLAPVRPGDVLTARSHVVEVRSSSRGDRGTVTFRQELRNQAGVEVMSLRGRGIFARRAPLPPTA